MIRLFLALEIPERVRERLAALGGGVPGARWMSDDQLHLTLRFIGEVDENVAHDIDDTLVGLRAPGFTLEFAGVGEFGSKTPRALWAGVRPNDALMHLQRKIETVLQRIGLPAEERKFTPHVTLARLRAASCAGVAEYLSARGYFLSRRFEAKRFVLFSSRASIGGGPYVVEAAYPLG